MLKIKPPNYKYCPYCATELKVRKRDKRKQKFCPNCGWVYYPHVFTAVNAVVIKNNKILLVKRAREPFINSWQLPGGYVNFGEHPDETVIRELKEETGLKTKKLELLVMIQSDEDPRAPGLFAFFYKVTANGDAHNMDSSENKNVGWFDMGHLPKIGWKSHIEIIKKLQSGQI